MYSESVDIDGYQVGPGHSAYFIADIAANHDGDLGRAKDLIYLAAEAGANAAKFQHFRAETIVSDTAFRSLDGVQSHQSDWKKSVFDVYKDASVSLDWNEELQATCRDAGIHFFTTPYDLDIVEKVAPQVPAFKIGSGDITWDEMLIKVAEQQKPYILACGASTLEEVTHAVAITTTINPKLILMQCNTNYTASLDNFKYINLNVLNRFKSEFPGLILGLSDHTPGHSTVLGAISLGAVAIEKHFTDDTSREGPDHKFSMCPKTWREMVERSRELQLALGTEEKKIEFNEMDSSIVQRRSVCAGRHLPSGHVLTEYDLVCLRPSPKGSIQPNKKQSVVGRTLQTAKAKGEVLFEADIA